MGENKKIRILRDIESCGICGEKGISTGYVGANGTIELCDSCFDNLFTICSECKLVKLIIDCYYEDDEWICDDCYRLRPIPDECGICGAYLGDLNSDKLPSENNYWGTMIPENVNMHLCDDCCEKIEQCDYCGDWWFKSQMYDFDNGLKRCPICNYKFNEGILH